MSAVYPKLPRVAVRDSFDEDDLSDIDDEVFIRDGSSGILKIDDDCGAKRPLMAPRRKCKAHFSETSQLSYRALFAPFCYILLGFFIILGTIILCIITITRFPMPINVLKSWLYYNKEKAFDKHVIPCTSLNSKIQWTRTLPKLTSEAPLRSNDVNGDSIEDIIVGFSTGLDKADTPEYVCTLDFDQSTPCLGGVLALDGRSGQTLWTHWTAHAVFSVDCGLDLNDDSVKDCIISGRGGILHAINGQDGSSIWELPYKDLSVLSQQRYYDVYDARYIADVDDDGIGDVVASHTWLSDGSRSEVILVSGKNGNKINSMDFPEKEQLFVAPQIIVHPDGETYFILVASNQDKSGGLYIIPHSKLLKGEFELRHIYNGPGKGVSLPPLLIDINSDGTEDIIVAMFNCTVMAFNGLTFKEIWNFTVPNSEVISIPIPGYYNDDNVPDFMVKHQIGPGFPVYYYSTATVLDGQTGKPLLEKPMEDTVSAEMSGLSVTVDGFGNDWFLHWSANCFNNEGAKDEYEFVSDPNSDVDLCKLRFNSTLVTSLYAFSQHVEPPGIPIYRSEDWKSLEFNDTLNTMDTESNVNSRFDYRDVDVENAMIVSNGLRSSKKPTNSEDNANVEYKSTNNEVFPRKGNFHGNNMKYDGTDNGERSESFLDKALEQLNEDEWKRKKWDGESLSMGNNNNGQPDDNYDDMYDDEDDERFIASRQLNEIRLQRSERPNARYINNNTNDVENQLDPSMDYTNGQSKQNNYYSSLNFNRSSNLEDGSDYMNIPDIDFVDNIKDAEALDDDKRKRETQVKRRNLSPRVDTVIDHDRRRIRFGKAAIGQRGIGYFMNKRLKRDGQAKYKTIPSYRNTLKKRTGDKVIGGVQRQSPTGTLLSSLKPNEKNTVDLIFSTYWLPPRATAFVLLPRDLECIRKAEGKLDRKPLAAEKDSIVGNCLASRGVDYRSYRVARDKEDPGAAVGQMTLYRMRLRCACPEDTLPGQSCKDISVRQSWPGHLGVSGNGYFEMLKAS